MPCRMMVDDNGGFIMNRQERILLRMPCGKEAINMFPLFFLFLGCGLLPPLSLLLLRSSVRSQQDGGENPRTSSPPIFGRTFCEAKDLTASKRTLTHNFGIAFLFFANGRTHNHELRHCPEPIIPPQHRSQLSSFSLHFVFAQPCCPRKS